MRRHVLTRLLMLCGIAYAAQLNASRLDSALNLPAMGVPVINLSPETGWVFGAAGQAYFRIGDAQRTSIVQVGGAYSLNKQWYVDAGGVLYFGGHCPWQLIFGGGYRDYPDVYFARGNGSEGTYIKTGTSYISRRGRALVSALWQPRGHWSVGPKITFYHERTRLEAYQYMLQWGLGLVAQYDSRDVLFYPSRGLFAKAEALYYEPYLGNTCRLGNIKLDVRQFIPLRFHPTYTAVFAWQLRTEWTLAARNSIVPFQMLPTLGGQDLIRGVRAGMYRDNALVALQAEMRLPIYSILHATLFAGIGDVYNIYDWQWAKPKVGYGVGLRATINRAKVNIRVDVARNNIQTNWRDPNSYMFYLTATEAF